MNAAPERKRELARQRQTARRARRAKGSAVLQIELPWIALTEALIDAGRLGGDMADDRDGAATAVEELLRDWIAVVTRDAVDPIDSV